MCKIDIYGGRRLEGEVEIQGSKNAVLPILAATLLTDEVCEIENCPDLTDVRAALEILENLGCRVGYKNRIATIKAGAVHGAEISHDLMRKMRSSIMFLGAILGRFKVAYISYPGGCELGARPIDIHLRALDRLGTEIDEKDGRINCRLLKYRPGTVTLMFPSVGATENIMLLSATELGETVIINPAREPEIVDLQNFLNCMGADIKGAGTDCIRIRGVKKLHGCKFRVMPDRIVAATYACAATAAGGEVLLKKAEPMHLLMFLSVLDEMGVMIRAKDDEILIKRDKRLSAVPLIKTMPYPGFPTDIQPLIMATLLKAEGSCILSETIFENRYKYTGELLRMGAEIQVEGQCAVVHGVEKLYGADVLAADLRGGAALVIAGLSAEGKTSIGEAGFIKRGYEDIAKEIRNLGGHAEWIE